MTKDKIIQIFGLPGQGKTTSLAAASTACLSGKYFLGIPPHKRIFSTVPLPFCYELDPFMLGKIDLRDSLLLIDEVSQFFDSRDWKVFPKHVRTFFQTARHEHISVILCSQSYADCDLRIRNLCHSYYLLEDFPYLSDFSVIKPISHLFGVSHGCFVDEYKLAPPITWKLINRKRYYQLFDSFCSFIKYEHYNLVKYGGYNPHVKNWKFAENLHMPLGAHTKPYKPPFFVPYTLYSDTPFNAIQSDFTTLKCINLQKEYRL